MRRLEKLNSVSCAIFIHLSFTFGATGTRSFTRNNMERTRRKVSFQLQQNKDFNLSENTIWSVCFSLQQLFFKSSLPTRCSLNSQPGDQESPTPPTEPARGPSQQQFNVTSNSAAFMHLLCTLYLDNNNYICHLEASLIHALSAISMWMLQYFTSLAFTAPRQRWCSKRPKLDINPSGYITKHSDRTAASNISQLWLIF